jgi:hypothetical protein
MPNMNVPGTPMSLHATGVARVPSTPERMDLYELEHGTRLENLLAPMFERSEPVVATTFLGTSIAAQIIRIISGSSELFPYSIDVL